MFLSLSRNTPKYYIKVLIMVGIMALFRLLPPPSGLSADGLAMVGVFFGVLFGWLFIDMVWPSFIGLAALGLTLPDPMDAVLAQTFGNSTFLLLLFFCMAASIINSAGVAEYLARRIMNAPFVDGRPYLMLVMLCLAMCALACMLTMTAAVLVAFPLIKEVCRQYGYKPGSILPMVLLMAMLYVADIAYLILPFKSMPAIVFGVYAQMSGGDSIELLPYMAVMLVMFLLSMGFILLLFRVVLRRDMTLMRSTRGHDDAGDSLSPYQKTVLWSFLGLIVLLLLPGLLPKNWPLAQLLNDLGTNGMLLVYMGLYLLLNFKEGIPLRDVMQTSVAWPALFLVAAVLRMTGAFSSAGVTTFIANLCGPMLQNVNGFFLVFFIIFCAATFTQLANNNASAAIFAPLAYTLAVANGSVNPQALLSCVILACACGITTPTSATTSAILYGDTLWVSQKKLFRFSLCFWLFNVLSSVFVAYPLLALVLS